MKHLCSEIFLKGVILKQKYMKKALVLVDREEFLEFKFGLFVMISFQLFFSLANHKDL